MRTRLWPALILALSPLSFMPSMTHAAEPTVMRIHHTAPLDHQITLALHAFALDVKTRTKGEVIVDVVTKPRETNPPISPANFIQAVADGTIEAACMPTFLWTKDIPEMDFSLIPFLFTGLDQMKAFPNSPAATALEQKINRRGVKTLAWLDVTRLTLITSTTAPITAPEDFKGKKIRVLDEFSKVPFEKLGATGNVMEASRVYRTIQAGGLDSVMTDISSAIGLKLFEVQKFATVTPYFSAFYHLYVNPAWMNKLSPVNRAAVEAAGRQLEKTAVTITEAKAAASLDILRANGVTLHLQTPTEQKEWEAAMQKPAVDAFTADLPERVRFLALLPRGGVQ